MPNINIKRTLLASAILVSSPLILMAAPVDLTDGSKTFHCTSKGMKIDASGKTVITLANLDCLKSENQDPDSDGDGYTDAVEKREGSDPNDKNSTPDDFDKDFIPDSTDPDDDNDGYTDIEEIKAGTNPKDFNSKPNPPPITTPISLEREKDILDKFNNHYVPYASKADLKPKTLKNGKKVYIVNPGYGATSIPSCLNGKNPQHNCRPTGWSMGVKKNEIYAVRQKTRAEYGSASMQITLNQKSGGLATDANYIFNISDKPGDMTGTPFRGKCKLSDEDDATGALYFAPLKSPLFAWGFYCEVPVDTVFYLNMELQPKSHENCDKSGNVCSGYFYTNSLASPKSYIEKDEVYDRFGKYLY